MIHYIKAKRFHTEHTTIDLECSKSEELYFLDEDDNGKRLYIVHSDTSVQNFIERQDPLIEAESLNYNDVKDEIKSSALFNNVIQEHERYRIGLLQ